MSKVSTKLSDFIGQDRDVESVVSRLEEFGLLSPVADRVEIEKSLRLAFQKERSAPRAPPGEFQIAGESRANKLWTSPFLSERGRAWEAVSYRTPWAGGLKQTGFETKLVQEWLEGKLKLQEDTTEQVVARQIQSAREDFDSTPNELAQYTLEQTVFGWLVILQQSSPQGHAFAERDHA